MWLEKFSLTESLKSNSEFSVPVICSCLVLTPVSMSALFPKKYKLSICRCHGPLFGNLRIFSELRLPVRFTGPAVVPVGQGGIIGGGIIGCVLLYYVLLHYTGCPVKLFKNETCGWVGGGGFGGGNQL